MPLYEYRNEFGQVIEKFFKMSEKPDSFVDENGVTFHYAMSAPAIVSGVGGIPVSDVLKSRINQIKKAHPSMQSNVSG